MYQISHQNIAKICCGGVSYRKKFYSIDLRVLFRPTHSYRPEPSETRPYAPRRSEARRATRRRSRSTASRTSIRTLLEDFTIPTANIIKLERPRRDALKLFISVTGQEHWRSGLVLTC